MSLVLLCKWDHLCHFSRFHTYALIKKKQHLHTTIYKLGFSCGSDGKKSACNTGDPRFDPWITNKDLLYSRGNSSQYPIITYNGNESERKWVSAHNWITWLYTCCQSTTQLLWKCHAKSQGHHEHRHPFLGSKITSDGDCSHEIKRRLLLAKKVMTNLDSILESRDITLPTKVHLVKVMVFPVVMYGCESWTVKKAESWRIVTFELWCWGSLLRVPWTARRSNQSTLKVISPGCSLEGLMLKLKLQHFVHMMWRADSFEKTLMPWNIEGRRRRE